MVGTPFKRPVIIAAALALMLCAGTFTPWAQQRPVADDADRPVRTTAQNPDAVAVVIGIQDYQHRDVPDVEFAVNDAEAVRRVLVQTLGYAEPRVLFLKNGEASFGRLKPLFRQQLPARIIPGRSDVFVYYSGHGAPNADTKEGYLLPWDYDPQYAPTSDSAYPLKELYADLDRLRARSVTVILEACFSGQSDSGSLTKDASDVRIEVVNPALTLPDGVVIAASSSNEIATWYRERQHGLMTYFWLRAMRGEAGDPEGWVTPERLRQYLRDNVSPMAQQLRGRNQTPEITTLQPNRALIQLPVSAVRSGAARLVETYGSLRISIDIGGDLYLDGILQATIPAGRAFEQQRIVAGPHEIEVRKDGFPPIREEVVIDSERLTAKTYRMAATLPTASRLERAYGLIEVTVDRGGALYLDNQKMEDLPPFGRYTTTRIEAGPHRVRVERPGFEIVDQELLVRPNETARLEVALRPVPVVPANPPASPIAVSGADRSAGTPTRDAIGMQFAKIPPGEFMMGCSPGDNECSGDEKPVHRVRITKSFEIGKYEVTQAQWETVMGSNPSNFKGSDRPVESVSWNDVQQFLQRLNARQDGYRYRLPTEAEWEYAARAGTTGSRYGSLDQVAWYVQNSGSQTHPVGQKAPNALGLYDMLGDVWEWVQDWYGETYYGGSPQNDPAGPSSGQYRGLRGGSWNGIEWYTRASVRGGRFEPGVRIINGGFRCVREAKARARRP